MDKMFDDSVQGLGEGRRTCVAVSGASALKPGPAARQHLGSAEFRLLVAAVRVGLGEPLIPVVEALLAAGVDHDRFLDLVDRNRLAPLVFRALRQVGDACADGGMVAALAERAQTNSYGAVLQGSELVRIQRHLQLAGVDCLFLKGPVLALQAYGDLALRHAGDLDLLVAPELIDTADSVLRQLGYRRDVPAFALTPRQRRVFEDHFADFGYLHTEHGLCVELHWRLIPNPRLLPITAGQMRRSRTRVVVGAVDTPTLAWVDLLLYLCAHGGKHGWFRLFWVVDIHVLLRMRPVDAQPALLDRARCVGVERILLQGMTLAHDLYATPLHPLIRAAARGDARVAALVAAATDALEVGETHWLAIGPTGLSSVLARYRYLLRLRAGAAYAWSVIAEGRVSLVDWQQLRLPDALFFLYVPLRLPLWLWRRGWAWRARSGDE